MDDLEKSTLHLHANRLTDQPQPPGVAVVAVDDADASRRLGVERGGLAFWVAAVRETYEEAGVLLARHLITRQIGLMGQCLSATWQYPVFLISNGR